MSEARRPKGTGGVYQRTRDGRWVASVQLPAGGDGKRKRKELTGKTKAEAEAKKKAFDRELARHGYNPGAALRTGDWLTQWLATTASAGDLAPRTIDGYRGYVDRYISPSVGRIVLGKLTPSHIDRLMLWMQGEKGLSPTTALQALNILKAALKDAERRGLIDRNPATLIRAPKKAYHEADVLTLEQAVAVLRWAWDQDAVTSARISLALLTGMRQSEVLGLTRQHVDLAAGVLEVKWQLQSLKTEPPKSRPSRHVGGSFWLTQPKSKAGARMVPIVDPLRVALARRLAEMSEDPWGFVVTAPRGGHSEATRDNGVWSDALAAAKVPVVKLHEARHTVATLLRAAGVDGDVVQSVMGHSSVLMTKHYQHLIDGEGAREMGKFGRLIEGTPIPRVDIVSSVNSSTITEES